MHLRDSIEDMGGYLRPTFHHPPPQGRPDITFLESQLRRFTDTRRHSRGLSEVAHTNVISKFKPNPDVDTEADRGGRVRGQGSEDAPFAGNRNCDSDPELRDAAVAAGIL